MWDEKATDIPSYIELAEVADDEVDNDRVDPRN
jgi:hypothetical protein